MDKRILLGGLLVALLLAVFISPLASPWPDGLERVAEDKGFIHMADIKPAISSPIPDYAWPGIDNQRIATSVAGLTGTLMLFVLASGLGYLLRKKNAS
ncbi:MAG: PDGLE domain-containing protein [Candidatus Omnitrophica bacterium]|nr:PDGLE domain-containing protein [Candidatus Omnitrophota bacterium]